MCQHTHGSSEWTQWYNSHIQCVSASPLDVSFQEVWQYMYLLTALVTCLSRSQPFCFVSLSGQIVFGLIEWWPPKSSFLAMKEDSIYLSKRESPPHDKGCLGKDERCLKKGDFTITLSTIMHLLCHIHKNIEYLQKVCFKVTLTI